MRGFPSFALPLAGAQKFPRFSENPFQLMSIPVFADGANPLASAPVIFFQYKKLLKKMALRDVEKRGDHYFFRERSEKFIPGPKPVYKETRCRVEKPERIPLAEIPGIKFIPPEGVPMKRLIAIPVEQAVGW